MNAYDDRPRRDIDVCKNIMDCLEAVAKEVFGMPTATFGNVLAELRKMQTLSPDTIANTANRATPQKKKNIIRP
jgi:hypothetical protein